MMDTIRRTPEENRTYALADFRDYLKGARSRAAKMRDRAREIIWKMEEVLKTLPDDAAIDGLDEAALLAATAVPIDVAYSLADDADDLHKGMEQPISELLGDLDNANGLHGYLAAGDFSDDE